MDIDDKYINVDFRMVIEYDRKKGEPRRRYLLGRQGLINIVGRDLYLSMIKRAYNQNSEKITMRLRRGASIIFYRK